MLRKAHADLLFAQLKSALIANFVVACITALVLGIDEGLVDFWLLLHALLTAARFYLYQQYQDRRPEAGALRPWLIAYAFAAGLSGLAWGLMPFAQPDIHSRADALFIGVVLAGVTAGALGTMSALRLMYALYAGMLLGSFACWAAFFAAPTMPGLAVLSLVFYATLLAASRRYNEQLVNAFDLGRRNQDLLDRVRSEHDELLAAQSVILHEQNVAAHVMESIVRPHNCSACGVRQSQRSLQGFVGDVVLFDTLPQRGIRVLLGDATGHGLSAALAAIPVAQTFGSINRKALSFEVLIDELNTNLHRLLPNSMFMAAVIIDVTVLDGGRCRARIWNGGLDDLLVIRGSGRIEQLPSRNLALGVLAARDFDPEFQELLLEPDDKVYAYTDGITEAHDASGALYGRDRLAMALMDARGSVDPLAAALHSLDRFLGDAALDDDLTLLEIHAGTLANDLFASRPRAPAPSKAELSTNA
ncbi:MAG: serine/threonine-protein phosphatase [Gammaproteobacteria bacterium]|nr:serine/threonine-protein phosphatase [Gammaproteobacteria bacterium]